MNKIQRNILIFLSVAAGIALFIIILLQFPLKDVAYYVRGFSPILVFCFLLISVGIMASLVLRWSIVLKSKGHSVPFHNLFVYKIIDFSICFLLPGPRVGGEPVRAAMLKKHGINFTEGLSTVIIDKTIEYSSSGLFFFMGVIIILVNFAMPESAKLLLIIPSTLLVVLVILFYYRMLNGKNVIFAVFKTFRLDRIAFLKKYEKKIKKFEDLIIRFYKHDKKYFVMAIGASVLSWVLMFVEYKVAILMLGYNASLMQLFLVFSFVGMAYLFPVPMAMGVLEASQISVFSIIKIKSTAGLVLSLLIRARDLIWVAFGLIALSYHGFKFGSTFEKTVGETLEKELEESKKNRTNIKKVKRKR